MSEDIQFTRQHAIGLITLNRPRALNALTLPMICALQQQLGRWQDDRQIHAVVIQSSSERAFCAGGDVRLVYDGRGVDTQQQLQFFWHEYRLNHFIHHYPKPFIAMMDGMTMGGGVGISLHGSNPVASDRFVFAMPETAIGLFPDVGASYLLSRCPGQLGIYLGLTGQRVGAAAAKALGLVKHRIDSDKFASVIDQLIHSDLSEDAAKRVDQCLNQFSQDGLIDAQLATSHWIDNVFHCKDMQSIFASLQQHPESIWHQETLNSLKHKSPLSLSVSLRQLRQARGRSLAECLNLDYCLAHHFIQGHDFYEGVRALLVDKDKTPHWQPKTIDEVTPELLERYFQPCENDLNL